MFFVLSGHKDHITAVALTPDGTSGVITSSRDGSARVWDARGGSEVAVLEAGSAGVHCCCSAARGVVVTAGDDGVARVRPLNRAFSHTTLLTKKILLMLFLPFGRMN
jgi:WD40 repeat protein